MNLAKASGKLPKTDKIDAQILAHFNQAKFQQQLNTWNNYRFWERSLLVFEIQLLKLLINELGQIL
jgi:hypothetical protein